MGRGAKNAPSEILCDGSSLPSAGRKVAALTRSMTRMRLTLARRPLRLGFGVGLGRVGGGLRLAGGMGERGLGWGPGVVIVHLPTVGWMAGFGLSGQVGGWCIWPEYLPRFLG